MCGSDPNLVCKFMFSSAYWAQKLAGLWNCPWRVGLVLRDLTDCADCIGIYDFLLLIIRLFFTVGATTLLVTFPPSRSEDWDSINHLHWFFIFICTPFERRIILFAFKLLCVQYSFNSVAHDQFSTDILLWKKKLKTLRRKII